MRRDDAYRRPAYAMSLVVSVRQRTTCHIVNVHAFTTVNVLAPSTSTDAAPNPADTSTTFFALVIAVNIVECGGDVTEEDERSGGFSNLCVNLDVVKSADHHVEDCGEQYSAPRRGEVG